MPVAKTRDLLERYLSDGLLAPLPEFSTIVFSHHDMYWWTGNLNQFPVALEAMLVDRSGRRFDGRIVEPEHRLDCPDSGLYPPQECEVPDGETAWVRVRARPGGGTVLLARLPAGTQDPFAADTTSLRAYSWSDDGDVRPPRLIAETAGGSAWTSDSLRWRSSWRDGDRAIYDSTVPPLRAVSIDDAAATFAFTTVGSPEEIVRIFGARQLLP